MEEIPAKRLLMRTKSNQWFATDYTLNLYHGCHHGCIYCDSRSQCYGIEQFDHVRRKSQAEWMLNNELSSIRKRGIIGSGSMSDSYNAYEKEEQLTRKSLELMNHYGFGVSIVTKSDLVVRDIDLLKKIQTHSPATVIFSFSTVDAEVAKKIERRICSPQVRLDALQKAADAGIRVGVALMPLLPYITDDPEAVLATLTAVQKAGAAFIYPLLGVTLRDRQKEYYYHALAKLFPEALAHYKKNDHNQYYVASPHTQQLQEMIGSFCQQHHLSYKMSDIIALIQEGYYFQQESLF